MAPLSVLMLNHEYPPVGGGGGYAGRNILRQFAGRADIVLDVIVSRPEPETAVERLADNITLYRVGVAKRSLQFWTRREVVQWMRKAYRLHRHLLETGRYDLAHAFFGFPTGMLTWRTAGRLPYILSLRGSDVPGLNTRFSLDYKLLGGLFKRIWRAASSVYACSNGLRERALRFLPDVQIGVVPNGVELDRFHPAGGDGGGQGPRLLTVGRLSASKRIEVVIDAVERLRRRVPQASLTIAGGGGLEGQLRQLLQARQIGRHIHLLGMVPAEQMPDLYRRHDLFITATASEGMSNAMLEAMASGLPIITTRCEGVEELIDGNGVILEAADPQAMADAAAALAGDGPAYRRMSAAARRRAERFTWHAAAETYLGHYRRIAGQAPEAI